MGWFDDISDWWSDSSDEVTGGIPDGWSSIDSVATSADDYSSLFDLSYDTDWFTTLGNTASTVGSTLGGIVKPVTGLLTAAMDSPTVMGMIGGAADAYSNQQIMDMTQAEIDRKNDLNDKHNASLQNPHEDITKRIRRI